jgi:hypothetical protein
MTEQTESPQAKTQPRKVEPKPMGTPEEQNEWVKQVGEGTARGMRNLPANFIPPY